MPTRVYAYNSRLSGDREIGSVDPTLIKVDESRLRDTEGAATEDGLKALYSSRARTLLDAVYDWSRFNSLPRAYRRIMSELTANRVTASELTTLTLRYGDTGTIRRIGLLLERQGAAAMKPVIAAIPRQLPAFQYNAPFAL